jgi:acyl-CoA thioester hydrolase
MMSDEAYAGRIDGRWHRLPVRVYYEDTDFSGVVYHANFLRYFERGRSDFLRVVGIGHASLLTLTPPLAFAVMAMNVAFKKPAKIDDSLVVNTIYESISGARLMINQTITRDGALLAEASVEACCISLDGRPRRAPKELLERFGPLLAQE